MFCRTGCDPARIGKSLSSVALHSAELRSDLSLVKRNLPSSMEYLSESPTFWKDFFGEEVSQKFFHPSTPEDFSQY